MRYGKRLTVAPGRDERELVASGAMKMPEQRLDRNAFWKRRSGNVPREVAIQAVLDSRAGEDR